MTISLIALDSARTATMGTGAVIPVLDAAIGSTGSGPSGAGGVTLADLATWFGANVAGPISGTSVTFTTNVKSVTALATPSAYAATTGAFFASTVSGATLMGFGTTGDVTLKNRAGTDVIVVTSNTTGVTMAGALAITGALSGVTTAAISTSATVTSASAVALAVGLAGATNPAFVIDSSTGSQAAGFKITGATAAGTVAAAVISSGADANLTINAKGTGTIGIGSVSTGTVTITPATIHSGDVTISTTKKLQCAVGTTTAASINFGSGGAAPSSPVNGDAWIESNTLKLRLNGATVTVTTA
jgi:hypothetical protein